MRWPVTKAWAHRRLCWLERGVGALGQNEWVGWEGSNGGRWGGHMQARVVVAAASRDAKLEKALNLSVNM
jgi:hypothetical protein